MSDRLLEIASNIENILERVRAEKLTLERAAIRAGRFLLEALDRYDLRDLPPWRGDIYHDIKSAELGEYPDQLPPGYRDPERRSPSAPVHAWIRTVFLLLEQSGGELFGPMFFPNGSVNERYIFEGCPLVAQAIRESVSAASLTQTNGKPNEAVGAEVGVSDPTKMRPASWFDEKTDGSLYPDLLRRAFRDKRIKGRKGKRYKYDVPSVCDEYPQYSHLLRD